MPVATRYRATRRGRAGGWGRHGTTHRLGWGLADQAVSSLTNFLVVIFVARSLGVRDFGIFSLAYATYAFSLNVSRGVATDPLVVRFSGVARKPWREAVQVASGTAAAVGCVVGATCAVIGIAMPDGLGGALIALGIVLPGLLLQDSWRYAFFAAGEGRRAFLNDLVWGLTLVLLLPFAAHVGGAAWFVLAWGVGAAVAALFGIFQARIRPRISGTRTWLSQQRELGARYLAENLSMSTVTQLRITFLGLIAGLAAVGQVRAAEVLLGPWLAVVMGLSMVAVPEAARAVRRSPSALLMFCTALAVVQAVGVVAWGLSIMFLVPDPVGTRLLGALWEPATALILPTTLAFAGIGLMNGASAGLRALAAARRSLRATLICAGAYLTGGVGGAAIADAAGSAWGIAAATAAGSLVWWYQLRAGLRDHHASTPSVDLPETEQPDMKATLL